MGWDLLDAGMANDGSLGVLDFWNEPQNEAILNFDGEI